MRLFVIFLSLMFLMNSFLNLKSLISLTLTLLLRTGTTWISGGDTHKKLSDEARRKLSEAHKGKKLSDETRRKMSEAHKSRKRKPHSAETRRKIGEAHKGKKRPQRSEEYRRKLSEAHRGKKIF